MKILGKINSLRRSWVDFDNKRSLKQYEYAQSIGRTRFIWIYGFFGCSLLLFISVTPALWITIDDIYTNKDVIIVQAIMTPFGGYFTGILTWRALQKKYGHKN